MAGEQFRRRPTRSSGSDAGRHDQAVHEKGSAGQPRRPRLSAGSGQVRGTERVASVQRSNATTTHSSTATTAKPPIGTHAFTTSACLGQVTKKWISHPPPRRSAVTLVTTAGRDDDRRRRPPSAGRGGDRRTGGRCPTGGVEGWDGATAAPDQRAWTWDASSPGGGFDPMEVPEGVRQAERVVRVRA